MLQCGKCVGLPSGFLPWGPRKKGKEYLCSPLAFTLLQLLKVKNWPCPIPLCYFQFWKAKCIHKDFFFFFFRFSTAFKLMQYFLLYLPESGVAHRMPYASRIALALGRKGTTAAGCALQRAQTAWVPKAEVGPSLPP